MLEDGIPTSAFPIRRNAFIGIEIEKNAPVSWRASAAVTTSAIALRKAFEVRRFARSRQVSEHFGKRLDCLASGFRSNQSELTKN